MKVLTHQRFHCVFITIVMAFEQCWIKDGFWIYFWLAIGAQNRHVVV